ncbi:hypothetical protein HWV62_8561 [Athelia sp. TMB]|nr:hypothetical protein HWV62_8561 [Athelia sp. TMB]
MSMQAVAVHGENDNWKNIALVVSGRTNKACRKRWLHSLSPHVKKSAWTPTEDSRLLALHTTHGPRWSLIARAIPGRTDDACAKRYREALDPALRKDEWTPEEDARLLVCVGSSGGGGGVKWGLVGAELRRSGLGCRNRLLERKRLSALSNQSPAVYHEDPPRHNPEPQPEIEWSGFSMLDVTRYWSGSGQESNTYPSSSYVRTQDFGAASFPQASGHDLGNVGVDLYPPQHQHALYPALSAVRESHPHLHIPPTAGLRGDVDHRPSDRTQLGLSYTCPSPPRELGIDRDTMDMNDTVHGDVPVDDMDGFSYNTAGTPARTSFDRITRPVDLDGDLDMDNGPIDDTPPGCSVRHDSAVPETTAPVIEESDRYRNSTTDLDDHDSSYHSQTRTNTTLLDSSDVAPSIAPPKPSGRKRRPTDILRLNGDLPLTSSPDVLPYACGHRLCWPLDAVESKNSYSTSRALSDHSKQEHATDVLGGGAPFRCALAGCGKSWKSVNGLQYHLQVSKAHFQKALESMSLPAQASKGTKKVHPCPHPNCQNQYKQLSGLRYHLSHVSILKDFITVVLMRSILL